MKSVNRISQNKVERYVIARMLGFGGSKKLWPWMTQEEHIWEYDRMRKRMMKELAEKYPQGYNRSDLQHEYIRLWLASWKEWFVWR